MTLSPQVCSEIAITPAGEKLPVQILKLLSSPGLYYSGLRLRDNISHLEKIQQAETNVHFAYAIKACSLRPVLQEIARSELRAEVQSLHEVRQANCAGIECRRLIWNGPRKSLSDLRHAAANGITIIIDSPSEGNDILDLWKDGLPVTGENLGIRLTLPKIEGYFSTQPNKLGMSYDETIALLGMLQAKRIAPYWFHCHALARTDSLEAYDRHVNLVSELLIRISLATGHYFRGVNLGGGFDSRLRLSSCKADIGDFASLAKKMLMSHPSFSIERLCFEPGRYVVEDSAFALGTVIRRKLREGRQWLVVDLSTNLLVPIPLARFDAATSTGDNCMPTSIVDGTCSPAGVLVADCYYPQAMEGAVIVFLNCGAYTSALMEPFLEPPAPIYWLEENRIDDVVSPQAAIQATDLFQAFSQLS